ncbi:MAG: sigma-70 family RNA polymerase sigma factor [Solirubrobacterales bacterium]|nr:sigma-70 family RNA polymerase sigma factor [Solirubrobacterales bacterium]
MSVATDNLTPQQAKLLNAARRGDETAFGALVDPRRPELHAHCYRMLGSLDDAEDALQEALLRAWRGLPRFEGRSSLRSWLYRIATNACLTLIEKRPKRVLPIDYGPSSIDPHDAVREPPTESVWIEPYPDEQLAVEDGPAAPEARYEQRESLELAFVAALQHLPPNQRAALIMREVLGFSALEVAEALETTTASVNSALQRARKLVDERLPAQSQQTTLRQLGDERLSEIVGEYMRALEQGDVESIVAMLTDDASWSMPPQPGWFHGHGAIVDFLVAHPFRLRWRDIPARASGQLAIGRYSWDDQRGTYRAHVLDVLTLRGEQISAVTAFIDRELFAHLGLPDELPPDG